MAKIPRGFFKDKPTLWGGSSTPLLERVISRAVAGREITDLIYDLIDEAGPEGYVYSPGMDDEYFYEVEDFHHFVKMGFLGMEAPKL
jgi:hypothetical protein